MTTPLAELAPNEQQLLDRVKELATGLAAEAAGFDERGGLARAKYLANKTAVAVAQLGIRIGGASGYLKASPIQRHLRDAQAGQLMAYSTEVLATEIGREVLGVAG